MTRCLVTSALVAAVTWGGAAAGEGNPGGASSGCPVSQAERAQGVHWIRAPQRGEWRLLDRWCRGTGPPLRRAPARPEPAEGIEAIAIAVWNVNVGGGSLAGLVADLRRGALGDGERVAHFVLLLQEALREGDAVPAKLPRAARAAARIFRSPAPEPRLGVDEVARREGLYAYYVPSMRNGPLAREDRGNAILSTLPLSDLAALELPLERQRRVAIAASVGGTNRAGMPWSLRLVNLHLEGRSRWSALHRSFGRGRARQMEWILEVLGARGAVALGGDFNTWFGEEEEPAVRLARASFPRPEVLPADATYAALGGLVERRVDHLFFRVPDGWEARYRVLADRRGSDHAPLLGEIRFGAAR